MHTLRIAFFGTPEFSVPTLVSLSNSFQVAAVVTQPDKPVGKGLHSQASPVAKMAEQLLLPIFKPAKLNDEAFKQQITAIEADLAVVVAYGKILPTWLLEWPQQGAINIHGSLLPKYRGASPIAAAILNGESNTGLTLIHMNAKMDEGDMLARVELPIAPDDTTASLSRKLSELSGDWIAPTLQNLSEGKLSPQAQDHAQATYSGKIHKEDGQVDLTNPPHNINNLIRAYYPWPGVWGYFKNKRVKLLPNQLVQMEGKKAVPLADFRHGHPDFPLSSF